MKKRLVTRDDNILNTLPGVDASQFVAKLQTVCLTLKNWFPAQANVRHVDRFGIGIRIGDFYAIRLIESLGLKAQGGVVRVSIAHYNPADEIDRLVRQLDEVLG